MTDRRFVRLGGLAGVLFFLTLFAGGIGEGTPPSLDGSTAKITSYVAGHRHALMVTGTFGATSMALLLVFIATLVQVTSEEGPATDQLPRIVGYTGTAAAVCFALVQTPATTVAILASQPGGLQDSSLVRSLLDLSSVIEGPYYLMASLLALAMGLLVVRRRILRVWFGWLAVVVAVSTAAGGGFAMAVVSGGGRSGTSAIGGGGLAILVLILSGIFLRAKLPTPSSASAPPEATPERATA